jgi:hypothetical protein
MMTMMNVVTTGVRAFHGRVEVGCEGRRASVSGEIQLPMSDIGFGAARDRATATSAMGDSLTHAQLLLLCVIYMDMLF